MDEQKARGRGREYYRRDVGMNRRLEEEGGGIQLYWFV